jgi:hypothetical protein
MLVGKHEGKSGCGMKMHFQATGWGGIDWICIAFVSAEVNLLVSKKGGKF